MEVKALNPLTVCSASRGLSFDVGSRLLGVTSPCGLSLCRWPVLGSGGTLQDGDQVRGQPGRYLHRLLPAHGAWRVPHHCQVRWQQHHGLSLHRQSHTSVHPQCCCVYVLLTLLFLYGALWAHVRFKRLTDALLHYPQFWSHSSVWFKVTLNWACMCGVFIMCMSWRKWTSRYWATLWLVIIFTRFFSCKQLAECLHSMWC